MFFQIPGCPLLSHMGLNSRTDLGTKGSAIWQTFVLAGGSKSKSGGSPCKAIHAILSSSLTKKCSNFV